MLDRWVRLVPAAALLALSLAGCALSSGRSAEVDAAMRIKPDATLLKDEPQPAEDRLPLRMALVMPANMPGGVTRLPTVPGAWVMGKRESGMVRQMETGLFAEHALMQALSKALGGELNSLPLAPAPAAGYGATLEMVSVRFDYDEHLRFLVPLPLPIVGTMVGEFEVRTRMALQLSLFDAQGQQVRTRAYDDGLRTGVWVYPGGYAVRTGEPDWQAGVQQMADGAAVRLAQRAVQDLREWHEAQRLKLRSF